MGEGDTQIHHEQEHNFLYGDMALYEVSVEPWDHGQTTL
jgi:hypothetical protein